MPRRLAATGLAILALAVVSPELAAACSCAAGGDLVLRYQNRPWVFIGTVTAVGNEAHRGPANLVSISLDEVFRSPEGAEIPRALRVGRPAAGGNCRLDLHGGSRWVFFLRDLHSWPSLCDENIPLAPDEDGEVSFWAEALPALLRGGAFDGDQPVFPWRFLGQRGDHCHLQIGFHKLSSEDRLSKDWPDSGRISLSVSRHAPLDGGIRFHYLGELESPLDPQRAWLAIGDRSLRLLRGRDPAKRTWGGWELDEGSFELLLRQFQVEGTESFEIQVEGEAPVRFRDALRTEAFERFEACRDSLPPANGGP
jgi:hypothetical protein